MRKLASKGECALFHKTFKIQIPIIPSHKIVKYYVGRKWESTWKYVRRNCRLKLR